MAKIVLHLVSWPLSFTDVGLIEVSIHSQFFYGWLAMFVFSTPASISPRRLYLSHNKVRFKYL